jgi:hypothetical protein
MELDVPDNQIEDGEISGNTEEFISGFSKTIKNRESYFRSSFTEKIQAKQLIDWNSHNDTKYLEFDIGSHDMLSDLSTLNVHMKCQIMEKKADGTLAKLKANDYVGLIPGGICQNSIRNLRIFIFGTQISPERTNRYSLMSYVYNYFDRDDYGLDGIDYASGN